MSSKGAVGPLQVSAQDAAIIAAIIEARVAPHAARLDATPLASLPAFGRKLGAAAKRKRRSRALIGVWNLQRLEALAGFYYLALFTLPDADAFLTAKEISAVHEILLALATALAARRGKRRLTRREADRRVRAWQEPAICEEDLQVDKRWKQRLQRRGEQEDLRGRTLVNPIPSVLLNLLAPIKISR
jgi:hypothetical protein